MDCTHGNGPAAIERQHAIAAFVAARWRGSVHHTPLGPARVDLLFTRDGDVLSVGEVKARRESFAQLRALDGYLVTFEKLQRGVDVAQALGVPYDLFVGFGDGAIGWFRIVDAAGVWRTRATQRVSETQATCNGGRARRVNAYLDWRDVVLLREPQTRRRA